MLHGFGTQVTRTELNKLEYACISLNERISADDYRKYTKVLANKIGHKVDEGSYQAK